MKRKVSFLVTLVMVFSLFSCIANAESEAKWVLVDVIDHEYGDYWNQTNKSESYNDVASYSRGNYSVTSTYIGDTDTYYNPPYVHGESLTVQAIWSTPPQTISKDEAVTLNVSIAPTANTLSAFKFSGSTRAFWENSNITNADGKYFYQVAWSSDPAKRYKALSDTVSFKPGIGSEGQKQSIWITFFSTNRLETEYVYEWSATKVPINSSPIPIPTPKPTPIPKPTPEPKTDPNYKVSGINVSDMYGEVLIRRGDADEDTGWELLEMDNIIYEGDHIKTAYKSGARLSMVDGTVLDMKEESEVIMSLPDNKDSKIKLVLGNIYTNVKKMVETGTMEVEMSQAVCGIKGTTFILTETGSASIVKVLEGNLEFRSINTGKAVEVKAGNMATVTKGGSPVVKTVSIPKEAKVWGKTIIELQLNNKYLKVNGVQSEIDPGRGTVPALVNSRTLIPIRSVVEALGGTIGYDGAEQRITIKLNNKTLEMWLNKTNIKLDGKTITMDVAPVSINGRTMVPVRFAAESFGYDVQWKQVDKRIIIQ